MTGYESKKAMAQDKITDEQGRPMTYWGGKAQPAQEPAIGDIRALKHRIHELEGEVIGYKRILDAQPAQEPMACIGTNGELMWLNKPRAIYSKPIPLYTAAPQPEQEPVAWGVFEGNLHDMFFTEAEAVEMAQLKGTHAEVKPLYTKEKNNAA